MHPDLNDYASRLERRARACILERRGTEPWAAIDDGEFSDWAVELNAIQARLNPACGALGVARGRPAAAIGDWREIPALPTEAFKEMDITSLAPEDRRWVFYSSGTTAASRSQVFHDPTSMSLYENLACLWFDALGLACAPDGGPFAIASLTPSPAEAPHSSLARMFGAFVERFGRAGSGFFGEVRPDGVWELDTASLEAALADHAGPWWVLGPAFHYVHWTDSLAARGTALTLPSGSRTLETGGYKGRSRELTRPELTAAITQWLNVPQARQYTEYGMCELASQAYEIPGPQGGGVLRFPPWARVRMVSPETGREAAADELGIVQVFDLANVAAALAIATGDLGKEVDGGLRLCGRRRGPARGCSLLAA